MTEFVDGQRGLLVSKIRAIVVGVLVAAGMLVPAVAAQASTPNTANANVASAMRVVPNAQATPDGTIDGCPDGDVCIYPEGADLANSNPTDEYRSYGTHKLSSQYNYHWVYNHQTGNAIAQVCKGSNGTQCDGALSAGVAYWVNFTPYNSIILAP
ncbi:MAG TPA: hypothetical protein VGJ45_37910 [Pseudonocardiaceae bacterium]